MSCAARYVRSVVLAGGLLVCLGCSSSSSPPSGAAPSGAGKTDVGATQETTLSPPASASAEGDEPEAAPQGSGGLTIGSGDDDDN